LPPPLVPPAFCRRRLPVVRCSRRTLSLLGTPLELMCWSIVLVEHGIEGRDRHAEDLSRLEQKLTEARESLK